MKLVQNSQTEKPGNTVTKLQKKELLTNILVQLQHLLFEAVDRDLATLSPFELIRNTHEMYYKAYAAQNNMEYHAPAIDKSAMDKLLPESLIMDRLGIKKQKTSRIKKSFKSKKRGHH